MKDLPINQVPDKFGEEWAFDILARVRGRKCESEVQSFLFCSDVKTNALVGKEGLKVSCKDFLWNLI